MIWYGIVGTTALAVLNRLVLMHHSWWPDAKTVDEKRMSKPGDEKISLPVPI